MKSLQSIAVVLALMFLLPATLCAAADAEPAEPKKVGHLLANEVMKAHTDDAYRRLCARIILSNEFNDNDVLELTIPVLNWPARLNHEKEGFNLADTLVQISTFQRLLTIAKEDATRAEVVRCAVLSMGHVMVLQPGFKKAVKERGAQSVFDEVKAWKLRRLESGEE